MSQLLYHTSQFLYHTSQFRILSFFTRILSFLSRIFIFCTKILSFLSWILSFLTRILSYLTRILSLPFLICSVFFSPEKFPLLVALMSDLQWSETKEVWLCQLWDAIVGVFNVKIGAFLQYQEKSESRISHFVALIKKILYNCIC